jgi:hypothetical protein
MVLQMRNGDQYFETRPLVKFIFRLVLTGELTTGQPANLNYTLMIE